ncbi:MAG: tetratricopeptide repeat protein [Candidatus Thermoplasmatota archaeon]
MSESRSRTKAEYIEGLLEGLRTNPKEPDLWANVADVFLETGQFEIAVRAFDMALKLDPNFHRAQIGLSVALDLCDEDMSAREGPSLRSTLWEALKVLEPLVGRLREGHRYRFVDVHALRVEKESQRRLARNPDDVDALFLRSAFLAKRGEFEEAMRLIDRIRALGTDYPGASEFRSQLHAMAAASAPRPAVRKARSKK